MLYKRPLTRFLSLLFLFLLSTCQKGSDPVLDLSHKTLSYEIKGVKYQTGNWEHPNYTDPFVTHGNHRFEIKTSPGDTLVQVILPWRRHDAKPETKDVVITIAESGEEITAKRILQTNREAGHLIFKANPNIQSYYAYYLPHESTGGYYPKVAYLTIHKENVPPSLASLNEQDIAALPIAEVVSAQSIDEFHSFYPMEVIATKAEVDSFLAHHQKEVYLFPEYRDYPIVMSNFLPYRWVCHDWSNQLQDEAQRGEYFTYQIGLYAPAQDLTSIKVEAGDLLAKGNKSISADRISCFNTEGIDLNGQPFTKNLNVPQAQVQPLWIGIDIPEDAQAGIYRGKVAISAEGISENIVELILNIKPELIPNHGDDQPQHMTRLRWLNSTLGSDTSFIVPPFIPVESKNNEVSLLGRKVMIGENGLPAGIQSFFPQEMTYLKEEAEDILAAPIIFEILGADGKKEEWRNGQIALNKSSRGQVNWSIANESEHFTQQIDGQLEYDGMLNYAIQIVAKEDIDLSNTILQIPYAKDAAKYMLGLGEKGRFRPASLNWNWDIDFHHEGLWLGNVNKGLQYVLRDENYERPLNTNFYHNKPLILPSSWGNEGKGGIRFEENRDQVVVENYSGPRTMTAGDTLYYNIRFLITPFKTIDTQAHFSTRFVHKYVPVDTALAYGGTVINVHHANEINPYINYPFFNLEQQKAYIDEAHSKGVKVKLYNTIRELTYKAHELHPMRSLGTEIFNDGEGGGHGWLQEHLVSNYHSAWHATRVNDAAILNKGTSRWTNYYIEGLNWLAKNQEIDGLYLDDIAFSRATVKRIVSVLNQHRPEIIIDLHSANQYNERDGYINSAFLYMEHIPYVTRLWFGEYFDYDADPDYWMAEVAGIPFGLPGEMLEKGGQPYRGMVYGMTTRVYGPYDPSGLWKLFDEFDIADSRMLGYWVEEVPIQTDKAGIKSTIYLKEDKAMIAIGSWSGKNELVKLAIDWEALGWNQADYRLYSPEIEDLQGYEEHTLGVPVPVERNEGSILILDRR
jgi:hypothetical protein